MEQIRFAIVGAGVIAEFHAAAIGEVDSARLTAVCDSVPERARALATKYGVDAETDLKALLARDDVDAVTIATPSGLHADIAVPAAKAGKHVLCEKPLEVTVERVQSIIDACDEAGVVLASVFQSRMSNNVRQIRETLDAGRFGRLVLASAQVKWMRSQEYYDGGKWRGTWELDGGGALMNQSIHSIDVLLHLAGAPVSVYAQTGTLTHTGIDVEDTAAAVVRFANGAMGVIEASTSCAPGFPRRLEISGEQGSVVLEDDRLIRWQFSDEQPDDEAIRSGETQDNRLRGGSSDPKAISHEGHRLLIQDMCEAIQDGREPAIPGREGIRAVELICAIYESARTGQPVSLSRRR